MEAFRELLKKVGSGTHTSQSLSRSEAASAMEKMLSGEATPAQIGAFFIAHRIRRPTGVELAGMLDCWQAQGPQIPAIDQGPVYILGIPYDGRSRTAPVSPLTALLLAAAGVPSLCHGGERMPTKYGIPLVELWQALGVDWTGLTLERTRTVLDRGGIGFVYTPCHFPAVAGLIPYRDQIGKRPPIATLELIWTPYAGEAHLVFGYVHPPTETTALAALDLHRPGLPLTTVKGLEGSCDLPHDRTVIIGRGTSATEGPLQRLLLHHQDYGISNHNPALTSASPADLAALIRGEDSPLLETVLWNGGCYLWQSDRAHSLGEGLLLAKELLASGRVAQQLKTLQALVAAS
jgi:anthranilate phosphoribosyltransferase